jgi:hypothetical protein
MRSRVCLPGSQQPRSNWSIDTVIVFFIVAHAVSITIAWDGGNIPWVAAIRATEGGPLLNACLWGVTPLMGSR